METNVTLLTRSRDHGHAISTIFAAFLRNPKRDFMFSQDGEEWIHGGMAVINIAELKAPFIHNLTSYKYCKKIYCELTNINTGEKEYRASAQEVADFLGYTIATVHSRLASEGILEGWRLIKVRSN